MYCIILTTKGISAIQADDGADILVVTTAINSNKIDDVVVIGEDTDLLVILLDYYELQSPFKIFLCIDTNTKDKRI